jgi:protein-S-isoprenylcysteine O-methyltransferase Ste14
MKIPQLKIPPVVIMLISAFIMWALSKIFPYLTYEFPVRWVIALILAATGGIIALSGIISFRRAKTTVNPVQFDSVSALVVSGIYSITRNPMYLGLLFVLLGWGYFLSSIITFAGIPLYMLYMTYFQIRYEETVLETKFGQAYVKYMKKVHRWI